MHILQVDKISKSFGGLQAIGDLEFAVEDGSIFGIIGPNGAGKTTLFSCLTGFHNIDEGQVVFDGERIDNLSPHKIARRGLVKTFQANRLFYELPVWKNLLIGFDCCPKPTGGGRFFNFKRRGDAAGFRGAAVSLIVAGAPNRFAAFTPRVGDTFSSCCPRRTREIRPSWAARARRSPSSGVTSNVTVGTT